MMKRNIIVGYFSSCRLLIHFLCLLLWGITINVITAEIVVPGRTILQREQLCTTNAILHANFHSYVQGIAYPLMWTRGLYGWYDSSNSYQTSSDPRTCALYTGLLNGNSPAPLLPWDCTQNISERSQWMWKPTQYIWSPGTIQLTLTDNLPAMDGSYRIGRGCLPGFYDNAYPELCDVQPAYGQTNIINDFSIDVATCVCGFDMGSYGCEDINECLENHGCPGNSFCSNSIGDYHCTCVPGYMNPVTRGTDATKGGSDCVVGTLFNVSNIQFDQFSTMISSFNINATVDFTLYAIADMVSNLEVEVRSHTQTLNFTNGVIDSGVAGVSKILVLDALSPGTQYKMEIQTPDIYYSSIITTKCYCQIINGDDTGIPTNAYATQTNGYVTFIFTDNSRCESAYSFARTSIPPNGTVIQSAIAFTADYYYFSQQVCTLDPYIPGLQAADNLRLSNLNVGQTYYYLIRASAQQSWRISNPVIIPFTIQWQASINGKVSISTGSGGLPIEGVLVEYQLFNANGTTLITSACTNPVNGWCQTTTASSGRFQITFSIVDASLNNFDEFPVQLRFAKSTDGIDHTFLCSEGTRDCSAKIMNGTTIGNDTSVAIVHLQHLEFGASMDVVDDTTIPFRGTVTVAGTDATGTGLGCPLVGVKVCLYDHTIRNQYSTDNSICTETDSDGEYELPAVIGTIVSPYVTFRNHTFAPYDPSQQVIFDTGIEVKADGIYEGYNLQDTTLANVTIEVAGGLCDRTLGKTTILMTMQGCSSWPGQMLQQDSFRQYYQVIAQVVDFQVYSISSPIDGSSRQVFVDALKDPKSIDLRGQENKNNPSPTPDSVNANKVDAENSVLVNTTEIQALKDQQSNSSQTLDPIRVRFQYNGTDVVDTQFGIMVTDTCGDNTGDADTYSYHVVSKLDLFLLTITVYQDYGYDDIAVCTKYSPDTTITIQNQVGVSNSVADVSWLQRMNDSSYFQQVPYLQDCNPSCTRTLLYDSNGEGAYYVEVLMAGQPNPTAPYTKSLFVSLDTTGASHKCDVVVTGDFELPGGFSVAVPTYKPIMAIRDPPGGGSYSYYNNMKTTVRLTLEHFESTTGFDTSFEADFGAEEEASLCVGLGVDVCVKTVEAKVRGGISLEGGSDYNTALSENTNTASLTTTWSYVTSSDQWSAGTLSDVFLVPSLNVIFKDITEVLWNESTCAYSEEKLKFSLDSPDNKPAISFLTYYSVQNIEIPELTRLRDAAQANVTSIVGCPQTLPTSLASVKALSTDCQSSLANRDAMQNAIDNWQSFLERHDNVSTLAAQGELPHTPYTWIESLQETGDVPDDMSHYSGLIPLKLAENAIPLQGTGQNKNSSQLKVINVITFTGGGSTFTFQLDNTNVATHMEKMSGVQPIQNSEGYLSVGAYSNDFISAAVVVGSKFSGQINYHVTQVDTQEDDQEDDTTIGFVLSDPDVGDVFDVEVYLDPDHGTFVFNTISGRSRCPNEEGTVPQEVASLQLTSRPTTLVSQDDSLVFQVELSNPGLIETTFQLYTSYPTDLVGQFVPQLNVAPNETVVTSVSLSAGLNSDYDAVELFMSSTCEYGGSSQEPAYTSIMLYNVVDETQPDGEKERIRFAQQCPGIVWAGSLAYDRSFRINLSNKNSDGSYSVLVSVRNPDAAYVSYADEVSDPSYRLQSAGLWFRRVGSASWSQAFYRPIPSSTTGQIIDFTTLNEDNFGYINVAWDVSSLGDGEYELEARTICSDPSGTLPDDYNVAYTDRLTGRIDRIPPRLFGLPQPLTSLYPGDDVTFDFVEEVDCAQPYTFTAAIHMGAMPSVSFDNVIFKNVLVTCESNAIAVALDPTKINLAKLAGSNMTVQLTNVMDLNGNSLVSPIKFTFYYSNWKVMNATTQFNTVMTMSTGSRRLSSVNLPTKGVLLDETELQYEVAIMANVTSYRVKVTFQCQGSDHGQECNTETTNSTVVGIEIKPPITYHDDRDRHDQHDSLTAYHTFQDNAKFGTDTDFSFRDITKPIIVLDDVDEWKRTEQRILTPSSSKNLPHSISSLNHHSRSLYRSNEGCEESTNIGNNNNDDEYHNGQIVDKINELLVANNELLRQNDQFKMIIVAFMLFQLVLLFGIILRNQSNK